MILSEQMIKGIQPARTVKMVADGGTGLTVMVQAIGAKGKPATKTYYWRGRVGDTVKKIKIARCGTMKLTEARTIAIGYTNMVREGRDPTLARKVARTKKRKTFDDVWQTYFTKVAMHLKTGTEKQRMYEKDVKPIVGKHALESVTRDDLRAIVRDVTDRSYTSGMQVYALLGAFYRWCEDEGEIAESPMFAKRWKAPAPRDRYLSEREIEWLLQACRSLRGGYTVKAGNGAKRENKAVGRWAHAVEVILRTGQRRNEILDLVESEVSDGVMTLPPARFKGGREHVLPLPPQVTALLGAVERPDANSERYFQRLGQCDRNLNIIRAKMVEIAGQEIPTWSLHDLRRTVDTHLREAWDEAVDRPVADADVIEAILGHSLKGVARHYNHATMSRNKRRVLEWWNHYLDGIGQVRLAKAA